MSSTRPSPLATLATLLWPLFLACSGLLAFVWLSGFGPGVIADPAFARKIPNADLRAALAFLSRAIDPVWITLAAVNLYLELARTEGLPTARRWCGVTLISGFVISFASAVWGLPLGPVYFPSNLGVKLGPVPFALPFLWLVIVVGARATVHRVFPRLPHPACAALTGIACALTNVALDPIAWKYRAWWLWYPTLRESPASQPWTASATWLAIGLILAYFMRSPNVLSKTTVRSNQAMWSFLLINALAALTYLLR